LKGRYFASIFFHFEPAAKNNLTAPASAPWRGALESPSEVLSAEQSIEVSSPSENVLSPPQAADQLWNPTFPHEIGPEPESEPVGLWPPHQQPQQELSISPVCHLAARNGDLHTVSLLANVNIAALVKKDNNGWEPIHEAARAGHLDVVKFLVRHGADVNTISNFGRGFSPLRIAKMYLDPNHPLLKYFLSMGAVDREPDPEPDL
jgi:hypothetical protein